MGRQVVPLEEADSDEAEGHNIQRTREELNKVTSVDKDEEDWSEECWMPSASKQKPTKPLETYGFVGE
ncbi:hypothetical protein NDU88_004913 [Pleurodeles waltl]|uniref:Uncharacterized protein n=1 Tax=Pleurodeles waltl TaxID=8319 RepID=A0AAV7L2T9_PLEWA|nr:hypothetical protein NDU88_004913 [Pleurodeles waltl]